MGEEVPLLLSRLARRYACVACISGRSVADARRLVGVGGIAYAGSHGAELLEPGAATPRVVPAFKSWERRVRRFADEHDTPDLRRLRIRIEDKGPIVAFHWRGVPDEDAARTHLEGLAQEAEGAGFAIHWGRKVLEVRPPVRIDKGQAVRDLVTRTQPRAALYAGDDATDLDAYDALDRLVADGRARAGAARRHPLRRGSGGDRRARRPGGRRPGGLPPRAGRARRRLMRFRDFLRIAVLLFGGGGDAAGGAVDRRRRARGRPRAALRLARLVAARGRRRTLAGPPADRDREHRDPARGRAQDQRAAGAGAGHGHLQPALAAGRADGGRRRRRLLHPAGAADRDRLRAADGAAVAAPVELRSRRSRGATGSSSGSTAARPSARRSCCACRACARSSRPRSRRGGTLRTQRQRERLRSLSSSGQLRVFATCSLVSQARRAVATP